MVRALNFVRSADGWTHVCEDLLREPAPLALVERLVEAQEPPAAFEAVAGHLELVHRVHVLHVKLDAGAVWSLGSPHVEILVPPRFEVERVVAVVEVR